MCSENVRTTHLENPRRERWNEMKWYMSCHGITLECRVMSWHVGGGGFLAWPPCHVWRWAFCRYVLSTAPLLLPFDSGFPTHSKPLGHDFSNQKMVRNLISVLFPRCCVVTWNMVLKCLWRCVACSNKNPRKFHGVQFNFHWRRLTQANHCIRISGCSASNQRPTKRLVTAWCCFPQCWVVTWNVVLKSVYMSVWLGRHEHNKVHGAIAFASACLCLCLRAVTTPQRWMIRPT